MANFSDYEKQFQLVRERILEQIKLDWQNVRLHTEQLRVCNKYFKQYDYLYILKDLELSEKYLDEAIDIINGFEPCPEEDIPEDMIFTKDEELDKEPEEIPEESSNEQDTLKEFIEYYKKVLEKDYDDKAYLMHKNEGENWWYFNGQCNAIQRLIDLLDKDLEKFKEKENDKDRRKTKLI